MMMDILIWGLFIVAIAIAAIIIVRKIPVIGSIDIKAQPGSRNQTVKNALIEQRLERKMTGLGQKLTKAFTPIWRGIKEAFTHLLKAVIELNKRYDHKLKARKASTQPAGEILTKVQQLIFEADEYMEKEQWNEAEQRLIEVVTLEPKNATAYHRLGDIYLELKNHEDARQTFEHLIKLNQSDDLAFSGLGKIAQAEGRMNEARDEYMHSIELNSKVAHHHLDLCKLLIDIGKYSDAVKSCKEAVKIEPNNPKMLSQLLIAYVDAKDPANAKATLERLKKVNPENQRLTEWQSLIDKL
ncbi:MAG: tetratricopeptide repeat protein [Patescibacteria group bacterium]